MMEEEYESKFTDVFISLFIEKKSDGTKNLILRGNDLFPRIGTRVQDEDMDNITFYMDANPEIVKLELCYNNITDVGLETLINNYLCFPNGLEELNLMGNNITANGIEKLSLMGESLTVKTLRLNGNKFGPQGGKLLALLLASNDSIKHLDIAETDQNLSSMAFVISVIREDQGFNRTITVLDISRIIPNFNRYQYSSAHLAETLGEMLRFNKTLIELHAQKCQFSGHDIEEMLHGMKFNRTLLFLDLGYNRIGDHGIELLSNYIKTRPNMLGLNVAGNIIGNVGARALSFGMPFSRLRLLDIGYNKITAEGVIDILNTIKKPYLLRYFCLWGNKFSHASNVIIHRMMLAKVLDQEHFDVKIYCVDRVLYAARYPSDWYKHRFYCEMDYGWPVDPKIKRIPIPDPDKVPKIDFKFYPKLPL